MLGTGKGLVALAVDLIRFHGPLTSGELQALLPRNWNAYLSSHGGVWLGQQLRHRPEVWRDSATKAWHYRDASSGAMSRETAVIRETFGPEVDRALEALQVSGVPRDAVAVLRRRLRADKRVVAAALDFVAEWERPGDEPMTPGLFLAGERLREAVEATRKREMQRV